MEKGGREEGMGCYRVDMRRDAGGGELERGYHVRLREDGEKKGGG